MRNHALKSTPTDKRQNGTVKAKNSLKSPPAKSSPEARKLIKAALRESRKYTKNKKPSARIAARLLRLPNHGQLMKMKDGLIRDTPAMEAAKQRAANRANRAYYMIESDLRIECSDVLPLAKSIESLAYQLAINCLPVEIRKES